MPAVATQSPPRLVYVVLVCGGRNYTNTTRIFYVLDGILAWVRAQSYLIGGMRLVHGAARGADMCADLWAERCGVQTAQHHADWDGLGKRDGPIRNGQMLVMEKPDLVVAFPGDKGTADMTAQALSSGVPVMQITEHGGSMLQPTKPRTTNRG
ncbi:MAG: DUF2493 domain-containing protein [bacterium]